MSAGDPPVLIVEDSAALAELYAHQLAASFPHCIKAETLAAARAGLQAGPPAAVLLDLRLPDGNGIEFLRELRSDRGPRGGMAVVVMTAHGSIAAAVEATRAGADDFLVKPFSPERLLTTLRNAMEKRRLAHLVQTMSPNLDGDSFEGFVGRDPAMQAVYRIIEQAARSRATVFITGESGTGKEVCAEAIHRRSARAAAPFVALNCAALPKELMESEVFGHVTGAFTGALTDREGAAARAHGGTLFLDEICEMDLALQSKLLRFLQTGTVQKVGSDHVQKYDVRVLCATNRDPMAEVEAGHFREDLYYRLYVIPVHLPALRERGGDALLIARHFLSLYGQEEGKSFTGFAADAERLIGRYAWPGNVRQLQNTLRSIAVLQDGGTVTAAMFPAEMLQEQRSGDLAAAPGAAGPPSHQAASSAAGQRRQAIRPLEVVEREAIEQAIALCDGNMTEAAQRLGISAKTIYRKRQSWAAGAPALIESP